MNYLIANNIRSAHNVGSLFRIADALNMGLILQGYTPYPRISKDTRLPYIIDKVENKIKKSAVQTFDRVTFKYIETEKDVLSWVNNNDISLYTLEISLEAQNIFNLSKEDINIPFALVIGNETAGVSDFFIENSKKVLFLPMYGKNGSLNVSVSAGIAAYQLHHLT